MDSLRYRFGTPALPRFPIISPSAFPESWAQPTTGNLFTFNSSATSLPPAKHWWDKPWVPAVVVALFVYSVMASVVLAWFLFMRSLEQRRPDQPLVELHEVDTANPLRAESVSHVSPSMPVTPSTIRLINAQPQARQTVLTPSIVQPNPSIVHLAPSCPLIPALSRPRLHLMTHLPVIRPRSRSFETSLLTSYEAELMRNNSLGQCPTPLSMAGAYPSSLSPPNSTSTTPTERFSVERRFDGHLRREKVTGDTYLETNLQGRSVKEKKERLRAMIYVQKRMGKTLADNNYSYSSGHFSNRQYCVDQGKSSNPHRSMSDIWAVVDRVRKVRDSLRASIYLER